MKLKLPLLIFFPSTENHTKCKKHKKYDFYSDWSFFSCSWNY